MTHNSTLTKNLDYECQPASSLLLGHLSPIIWQEGNSEVNQNSRNRQHNPPPAPHAQITLGLALAEKKSRFSVTTVCLVPQEKGFTCAMKGVMSAPTLAIPLHVPRPKARVAVG